MILLGEIVVAEVVVVFVAVVVVVVAGVVVVVCRMGGGGREVSGSCVDWLLYFDLSPDDEYLTDTTLTDLLTLTSDGSG